MHGTTIVLEFFALWIAYTLIQHYVIEGKIMKWKSMGDLRDCVDQYGDDCRYRARGYEGETHWNS